MPAFRFPFSAQPATGGRSLPPVPPAFFLAVGLLLVLAACLGPGLIFGLSQYADVEHLRRVRYHDATFRYLPIVLTRTGLAMAQSAWLTLLLGSGALLVWQWRRRGRLYQELAALRREWRTAPSLLAPWRRLPPAERRTAGLLLAGLLLARAYFVLHYPLYGDEVVTYLSFVREGPLSAVSFYPIPNNHIGYSVLCWLASLISPNIYWTMRLPTLLVSAAGTALVGLLLLRRVGFRVAALAVFLFGFFPYALFQAAVGRGYFLMAVCAQLAFLAAWELLRGTRRPRLAWALLMGSSAAGLYAMPTFLLVFGSLLAVLGGHYALRGHGGTLRALALAAAVTGLGTALLYAPVLVVSGPRALFANSYVTAGAGRTADLTALSFLYRTEGQLLGVAPLGLGLLLVLSLAGLVLSRTRPGAGRLMGLLLGLLWLPYLLLLSRGVFPPARVLSYRMFFLFLLGALLLEALLRRQPLPALRRPAVAVALPVLLWAALALLLVQRRARLEASRNERVAQVYAWLQQRGARHVVAEPPHYQLYLQFFSQASGNSRLRVAADHEIKPGTPYQFYLLDKERYRKFHIPLRPVFENEDVRVYPWPIGR